NSCIALRRDPDIRREQLDQTPPTELHHARDLADIGAGLIESRAGYRDHPMLSVSLPPSDQRLLEECESVVWRRIDQALAERSGVRAPDILERDVAIGELSSRNAERPSAAWHEVNADDRCVLARIDVKRRVIATGHHRAWKALYAPLRVVDAELVLGDIDDQLDSSA